MKCLKYISTGNSSFRPVKDVLKQIAAIKACKKGSYFGKDKPCTCGWHERAAARKKARQKAASGKYKNIFINK